MLSLKSASKTLLLTLIILAIGNLAFAELPKAPEYFGGERGSIINPPNTEADAVWNRFLQNATHR